MRAVRAAGDADDRAARVGIPPRRTEAGERGHDVDAAAVGNRFGERAGLGRVGDHAQAVAEPLDRGAGHEDRAFHRVGDVVGGAERPRDRREQSVDRLGQGRADVGEHERAGAVGVLRHARLDARLSEQRRLLIARDPADRNREPGGAIGAGNAEASARRRDRGEDRPRNVEERAQLVGPVAALDVVEHRAARVRRIGRVHAAVGAAGQVPEDPRVDGAEHEVGVGGRRRRRAAATRACVAEKYGSSTRPVLRRISGSWPASRSASQRAAVRRSCQTIARCRGRPVRRSHTTTVSRWFVMPIAATVSPAARSSDATSPSVSTVTRQMSSASCSTHPGCGKCCGNSRYEEARESVGTDRETPDAGGARVDRDHAGHVSTSGPSTARDTLGRVQARQLQART